MKVFIGLLLAAAMNPIFAAAPRICEMTQSAPSEVDSQWEYLIIAVNTPTYTSGATGKSSSYYRGGLLEALAVQSKCDFLGQHGWELTACLGAIGGDNALYFKRHYDPARSSREREQAWKPSAPVPNAPKSSLINTDVEAADKDEAFLKARIEDKIRIAAQSITAPGESLSSVTAEFSIGRNTEGDTLLSGGVVITIVIDVSSTLAADGTYSGIRVRENAYKREIPFCKAAGMKDGVFEAQTWGALYEIVLAAKDNGVLVPIGKESGYSEFPLKDFRKT